MRTDLLNLTKKEWFVFRNIVFEAFFYRTLRPEAILLKEHPVVVLVERYLADPQGRLIDVDEAAKLVALAKPGIDPKVAEEHYWLVLDKS